MNAKNLIIGLGILIVSLTGCKQLLHGQEQPVISKGKGVYYTTCSGAAEHWLQCNNKASRTCPKGYGVLEKEENANGGVRTMTFVCN